MTLEEIKTYIREWLVTKSGLDNDKVIFAFQNAPKPNQDFITLNPSLAIRNISNDEKVNNTDGTITSIQRKEIDMSINCYGNNSESIMNDVLDSLFLPDSIQDFNLNNIVVFSDSSIRNLSFIENNQWVKRFQLDLRVRFIKETTQDLGYFDTITITTELDTDKVTEYYDTLSISLEREENTNDVISSILESSVERESNDNQVIHNLIELNLERDNNNNSVIKNIIETNLSYEAQAIYTQRNVIDTEIVLNSNPENIFVPVFYPVINLRIFEYLLQNLNDTSGNNINLIAVNKNASQDVLFDFQFDETNGLNDNSGNNNNLIAFNPVNTNYILFNFNFQTLNDNSGNNNNLVTI